MILNRINPKVATRDCQHCLKFVYDESTGKPRLMKRGDKLVEIERAKAFIPAPCRDLHGDGCPKGTPENPRTWTEKNRLAYRFDRECRRTGNWPDDQRVRDNATLIDWAEQWIADRKWSIQQQQSEALATLLEMAIRTRLV